MVVALSAGLLCLFAFRSSLPFPLPFANTAEEISTPDSLNGTDNYGLDRLEEEPSELSDENWLPEISVGVEAIGRAAGHLLDTISYQEWHRYAKAIVLNQNPGNLLPLHPAQQVRVIRPEGRVFPIFNKDLQQIANFTELAWATNLPQLEAACTQQEITVLLIDDASRLALENDYAGILQLAQERPTIIVYFGEDTGTIIPALPVPVLMLPDYSPTAQAMAVQLLYGAQNMTMLSGGILAASRLGHAPPEVVGIDRDKLRGIDQYVQRAIRKKAMPGCQVLVAKSGRIIYDKTFGHHTYDKLQAVDPQDVYDLASLTKATATTLGLMHLYDQQKIDLSKRIRDYLPVYDKSGVKYLRLRHLLSHHTGLQANLPIAHWLRRDDLFNTQKTGDYLTGIGKNVYLKNGVRESLLAEITKVRTARRPYYRYSDVNFLLLQQVVEATGGLPLDVYLEQNFYAPLGLHRLQYRPGLRLPDEEIVPTEQDKKWRHQLVRGEVHDESALLMGGVAGHAGLFSNARDLAVVFQMLLNDGSYGGEEFLEASTIEKFTSRNGYNYRAFGFDRLVGHSKSLTAYGASKATFGHTGFTGTCVWADPDNDLVFIFLSNRIHPDKYNNKLQKMGVRERLHKLIYQSLDTFRGDEV
jgi:CubicO group peptidase (beta-lactamase class C family)